MPESIRDGKGSGFMAGVSDENRLLVNGVAVPLRTHVSNNHGQSYTFNTQNYTLSATDTWHWVMWWEVTSTTRDMHVDQILVDWNGGSTNFNRPLQLRNVIPTAGQPTGNQTLSVASNNNKLSGNKAELTIYKWDGANAGMTDSTGPAGGNSYHPQGHTALDFKGSIITGLGEMVGIQVQSPEVGDFSLGLSVYFIDKEADI